MPEEAWKILQEQSPAVLVDVRTPPEWAFVGEPDLSSLHKKQVRLPWRVFPSMDVNPNFIQSFAQEHIAKETSVFFLCKSGGRSLDAAIAATEAGWQCCYNIACGFEGDTDMQGHRGTVNGWKAAGLPWRQN